MSTYSGFAGADPETKGPFRSFLGTTRFPLGSALVIELTNQTKNDQSIIREMKDAFLVMFEVE